jgi:hypothetical protein
VERSKVGDAVLKAAGRLTTVGTLSNPVAQTVRNLIGRVMLGLVPIQHEFADTMTEVSIGYPDSPLNGPGQRGGNGPKPGERVIPAAGQTPIGSGSAPLFALLAERTTATAGLLTRFAELLEPDIRPPLCVGGLWLVRPDGYVACSSGNTEVIARYLDDVIHMASRPSVYAGPP